jgi:hypothetical protein
MLAKQLGRMDGRMPVSTGTDAGHAYVPKYMHIHGTHNQHGQYKRRMAPRKKKGSIYIGEVAATSPPRVPASPHHPRTNQSAHARTHA